ncbi:MAG: multiheme c-type cytochrome [Fuerstiella sp.]
MKFIVLNSDCQLCKSNQPSRFAGRPWRVLMLPLLTFFLTGCADSTTQSSQGDRSSTDVSSSGQVVAGDDAAQQPAESIGSETLEETGSAATRPNEGPSAAAAASPNVVSSKSKPSVDGSKGVDGSQAEESDASQLKAVAERIRAKRVLPWRDWEAPQVGLMLTSEMHGFFEPCGCTANQLGGMSRRADLFQKLTGAGWSMRGLDVGGLSRRSVRQSQIKFETTLAALKQLKYAAIGIGIDELNLKPEFLLTQHLTDAEDSIHFLSANLQFYGIADLGTPAASRIFVENGVKVGVTGVMSNDVQKRVLPHPDITWTEPVPGLKKIMQEFDDAEVDIRILLSQSTVEESMQLAKDVPGFDVVLTAEGIGDPDPGAAPKSVGKTLIIEAGRKGKHAGVLAYYPDAAEQKLKYQLVALERDDFEETQSMVALMASYQKRLQDEKIVVADTVGAPHPSGNTFVGADKCGECHSTAFEIWEKTPHAHGFESLDPVHKRIGFERLNGIARMHDPECLSCHVTGWNPQEYFRYRSGFINEEFAELPKNKMLDQLLRGNQCENCHGPGSAHVKLADDGAEGDIGASVRVTLEAAKAGMCETCHDVDNSPDYDFEKYWDEVKHYGLD